MSQVAGRAGRKEKQGNVIIQTSIPENKVIRQVINNDYDSFYTTQLHERHEFAYPPFSRLITVTLKHTKQDALQKQAKELKPVLVKIFGKDVAGPEAPLVSRIQNKFILNFRIKIKRNNVTNIKNILLEDITKFRTTHNVQIILDVDPYF